MQELERAAPARIVGVVVAAALAADLYRQVAVPPATPWLGATVPSPPAVSVFGSVLRFDAAAGTPPRWWGGRTRHPDGWRTRVLSGTQGTAAIDAGVDRALVHAASTTMVLSAAAEWRRP
jgi:hypothetical protein